MSTVHRGNMLNEITFEEHDGVLNAKRIVSAATIYAVVNTGAAEVQNSIVTVANPVTLGSNVTLNPGPNFIGITTVANIDRTITGNVTLSDAKTFIGLTTVVQASSVRSLIGNLTLSDSKGFIGLITVVQASTVRSLVGNLTLSDSKGFIGLTTVVQASAARTITGNLTLSDSKGFLGLVTAVQAYGSGSTVFTGVISATGNTTVLVAPVSNRFFIKNLHISSLGKSEVEVRSGVTTLIPFTSLSTTSGFASHFGEMGLPARAQADALVLNLNGGATISYMVNCRFEA